MNEYRSSENTLSFPQRKYQQQQSKSSIRLHFPFRQSTRSASTPSSIPYLYLFGVFFLFFFFFFFYVHKNPFNGFIHVPFLELLWAPHRHTNVSINYTMHRAPATKRIEVRNENMLKLLEITCKRM